MIIEANGAALYCETRGSGPPLFLLHGNGEDHGIFDAIAPRLAEQFTLYLPDTRMHGRSGGEVITYDLMCEDLRALIAAFGLARTRVVGFSDGAITALLLALRAPELLESMALLGVNLCPEDFGAEALREMRDEYERTGDPLLRLMLEEPHIELASLAAVPVPALVVAGEHDYYPQTLYRDITRTLPDAQLQIVAGAGHTDYLIGTDRLYPDLARFFGAAL